MFKDECYFWFVDVVTFVNTNKSITFNGQQNLEKTCTMHPDRSKFKFIHPLP